MTDKKNPRELAPSNKGTSLQSSGNGSKNLLDQAVQNLSPEELAALKSKALEEKLRLEVEAVERSADYQYGKKAAEDHVETFNMLEKGGRLTGQKVVSDIKTGAGNMKLESKSGTTCFVATAAYGDPDHEDVAFLRQFRNKTLKKHLLGRAFILVYRKVGPVLAKPVKANRTLKLIAHGLISSLVRVLRRREA